MEALLLRFDAPLMSFGGPAVDHVGVTEEFPARSMLAGLIANALAYHHHQTLEAQRLQARIHFATRRDREGKRIEDYQTVDLGQSHLRDTGWTTWGEPETREGAYSEETHIRNRHYLADAIYTVTLNLRPPEEPPTLDEIARALEFPARPLFIGRKPCLPSAPILLGRASGESFRALLEQIPRVPERGDTGPLTGWWPAEEGVDDTSSRLVPVTDDRDWANQIHVGRRFLRQGIVNPAEMGS